MKTMILLSGGLDSATALAHYRKCGDECSALVFHYGQPHAVEVEAAAEIARFYDCPFELRYLPHLSKINDVVFAGRNLFFVAHAVVMAQTTKIDAVAIGCNRSDWLRFPDCRPGFWKAVDLAASAYDVEVRVPFIDMDKVAVVSYARQLEVPIELTWSCYDPQNRQPCGKCLACTTRAEALIAQA